MYIYIPLPTEPYIFVGFVWEPRVYSWLLLKPRVLSRNPGFFTKPYIFMFWHSFDRFLPLRVLAWSFQIMRGYVFFNFVLKIIGSNRSLGTTHTTRTWTINNSNAASQHSKEFMFFFELVEALRTYNQVIQQIQQFGRSERLLFFHILWFFYGFAAKGSAKPDQTHVPTTCHKKRQTIFYRVRLVRV